MAKLCVINVVGMTPRLLAHAPRMRGIGQAKPWRSPLPAVTYPCQATMLTGLPPSRHGVVGNGWLFRDSGEVRFWQQAASLLAGEPLYEGLRTASLFWFFMLGAPLETCVIPRPHYGSDGSKVFDIIDSSGLELQRRLGPFPFPAFWGPRAGLASSRWIAEAAALVLRRKPPDLTLVYLPHLDYDYQRHGPGDPGPVAEVDGCVGTILDAAEESDTRVVVVSEYGLVPVKRPVLINQALRRAGWLEVRDGPFGEQLSTWTSKAFAAADHQLAHLYLRGLPKAEVRREVERLEGVAGVVEPAELELDSPRSGELIALAQPDSWFAYPYWLDRARAPDFAPTVDIHRKPGYDPCELFLTSGLRAGLRLLQKNLGFRYRFDVVPLDPLLVKGSHGLRNAPEDGPLILSDDDPQQRPGEMQGFKAYIRKRVTGQP